MLRSNTAFEKWITQQEIPVLRGYSVDDLYSVELSYWERIGGPCAAIVLEGTEGWTSAFLLEIPINGTLKAERHLFESQIYVLSGAGETRFWAEDQPAQIMAWKEGSLFSPPLNIWHQHRNIGDKPARYIAVTYAPIMFNMFRNADFIFSCPFTFADRHAGPDSYVNTVELDQKTLTGSIVQDVTPIPLIYDVTKDAGFGVGFGILNFELSHNTMLGHIGELQSGMYKKAHRHTQGAHIIALNGEGYSLMWIDDQPKVRINWHRGSVFSPPEGWFHQHFNTGVETARHVAITRGAKGIGKVYAPGLDVKLGGDQIEYVDEDPEIRQLFLEELAPKGLQCNMPPVRQ